MVCEMKCAPFFLSIFKKVSREFFFHIVGEIQMQSSAILGVIAFILFHAFVTLPLASLTAERFLIPWVHGSTVDLPNFPDWVIIVATFVAMSLVFMLRSHVIGVNAHRHVE